MLHQEGILVCGHPAKFFLPDVCIYVCRSVELCIKDTFILRCAFYYTLA